MDPNREQVRRLFNRFLPYGRMTYAFYRRFPLYVHLLWMSLICWMLIFNRFFIQHKQFYPTVIAMSKSKAAQCLFEIDCAIICYYFYLLLVNIFFAPLTAFERDEMNESTVSHLMDGLLFLTLVRGKTDVGILTELTILTMTKGLIMLAEMRVDAYAVAQEFSRLRHVKTLMVLFLSLYTSFRHIGSAYYRLMDETSSEVHHLVLGTEHLLIITAVLYTLFKYKLFHYCRQNPAYHRKEELLKAVEVIASFIRCAVYLHLVIYITVHDTTPLFLLRSLYLSCREFAESYTTWRRARKAIRDLEKNIFDISAEELTAMDDTLCVICRDEMTTETRQKKLACGHCFHMQCLRDWLQRQPKCPTCRADVYANPLPPPPPLEPIPDGEGRDYFDGLFATLDNMPSEVIRLSNRLARIANEALDPWDYHRAPIRPALIPPRVFREEADTSGISHEEMVELMGLMKESLEIRAQALDQLLHMAERAHRDMLTELENARLIGRDLLARSGTEEFLPEDFETHRDFMANVIQLREQVEQICITVPDNQDVDDN